MIVLSRKIIDDILVKLHEYEDEGLWGEGWKSSELIDLIKLLEERKEKDVCNCHCSSPGMWHDQGCDMRQLPVSNMWNDV